MKAVSPPNVSIEENSYSKENHEIDKSTVAINGITLSHTIIQVIMERDGTHMSHIVKDVMCSPPATLPTIMDYCTVGETVDGIDRKILS